MGGGDAEKAKPERLRASGTLRGLLRDYEDTEAEQAVASRAFCQLMRKIWDMGSREDVENRRGGAVEHLAQMTVRLRDQLREIEKAPGMSSEW